MLCTLLARGAAAWVLEGVDGLLDLLVPVVLVTDVHDADGHDAGGHGALLLSCIQPCRASDVLVQDGHDADGHDADSHDEQRCCSVTYKATVQSH